MNEQKKEILNSHFQVTLSITPQDILEELNSIPSPEAEQINLHVINTFRKYNLLNENGYRVANYISEFGLY